MSQRLTINKIILEQIARYPHVEWRELQPNRNFLFGRNGAGKSSVINTIDFALRFIGELKNKNYNHIKTYQSARVVVEFSDNDIIPLQLDPEITKVQKYLPDERKNKLLRDIKFISFLETRQPQEIIGAPTRTNELTLRDHPNIRYARTVANIKGLLQKNDAVGRLLFEYAERIFGPDLSMDSWITSQIKSRSKNQIRPLSCGQYDALALLLDTILLAKAIEKSTPEGVFVLIDSPETFLHPEAEPKLLDAIDEILNNPQFFISTHSLRLLTSASASSVFWISRDSASIQNVTNLPEQSKEVFFSLYGYDVAASVAALLTDLSGQRYLEFLYECADAAQMPHRTTEQRSSNHILKEAANQFSSSVLSILDYGAGTGDLLHLLIEKDRIDDNTQYVAINLSMETELEKQIDEYKLARKISPDSIQLAFAAEYSAELLKHFSVNHFDRVFCINTLHEIPFRDLGNLFASLFQLTATNGIVGIFEANYFSFGESDFIMWTNDDLITIFGQFSNQCIEVTKIPRGNFTSIRKIQCLPDGYLDLSRRLQKSFQDYLPFKTEILLAKIREIKNSIKTAPNTANRETQKRKLAFYVSQLAHVSLCKS